MRSLISLAGVAALSCSLLAQDVTYELIEVGHLQPGGSIPEAYLFDINDVGVACGFSSYQSFYAGYMWERGVGQSIVPLTFPRAINNLGMIVGDGILFDSRTGTTTNIPPPDPNYPWVRSEGINEAGIVVGYAEWRTGSSDGVQQIPIVWDPVGGTRSISVPGARELLRINNSNVAVGNIRMSAGDSEAFVYKLDTDEVINLHALLSPTGIGTSEAHDINDRGVVVGSGWNGSATVPFLWSEADGFTILPGLNGGSTMRVHPRGINNSNQVTGWALDGVENDWKAFLWDPIHGMRDLAQLVPGIGEFILDRAMKINEDGWIVGDGHTGPGFGLGEPFVLRRIRLALSISPDTVSVGETVAFSTEDGMPGGAAMLVLADLNGVPFFRPVVFGTFDPGGVWQFAATVPAEVAGMTATFRSFGWTAQGKLDQTAEVGVVFH